MTGIMSTRFWSLADVDSLKAKHISVTVVGNVWCLLDVLGGGFSGSVCQLCPVVSLVEVLVVLLVSGGV